MYEIVKTARQQRKFAATWEYFCDINGWYNDPYAINENRYNLLLHTTFIYKRKRVISHYA